MAQHPYRLTSIVLAAVAVGLLSGGSLRANVDTGFLDRTVSVKGTVYRYQVYVPPGYDASKQWPVVLWMHGNGTQGSDGLLPTNRGLGEYIRVHRNDFEALAVFPQAPLGGNWIAPDTQAVAMATLDRTLAEFSCDRDGVSLIGYSMGAIGAYRIAYRWPERFSALVAIAGRVEVSTLTPELTAFDRALHPFVNASDPFAVLAARLGPLAIRLYHGDRDTVIEVDQSRRFSAALKAVGARATYTEFAGADHNATPVRAFDEQGLIPWLLAQQRQSERRPEQ
jgi:predicted peptidase